MAHGGEELVLELTSALGLFLCASECFLGALLQGDIVEHHDPSLEGAILTLQRPAGYAKQAAIRHIRVTNEHLYRVPILATHRANQRQFVRGKDGNAVRAKCAILLRPLVGTYVGSADANEPLGGRIEEQKLPVGVGHNNAVRDTP